MSIFANSSSGAGNGVSTERYATPCDTPLTKKVQDTRGRCGTGGEAVGEVGGVTVVDVVVEEEEEDEEEVEEEEEEEEEDEDEDEDEEEEEALAMVPPLFTRTPSSASTSIVSSSSKYKWNPMTSPTP